MEENANLRLMANEQKSIFYIFIEKLDEFNVTNSIIILFL